MKYLFHCVMIPTKAWLSSGLSQPAQAKTNNITPPLMGFPACFCNVGCVAAVKTPFISPHKRFHTSPKLSPLSHFPPSETLNHTFLSLTLNCLLAFLINVTVLHALLLRLQITSTGTHTNSREWITTETEDRTPSLSAERKQKVRSVQCRSFEFITVPS